MEKRSKVALAIIAKDKEELIERLLQSTQGVFDVYCLQDTGSSDQTVEVFSNWCQKNKKEFYVGKGRLATDKDKVLEKVSDTIIDDGVYFDKEGEVQAGKPKYFKGHYNKYGPGIYASVLVDGKSTLGDFASARNDSFALIPQGVKYGFWLDTDDTLQFPEQLPILVDLCDKNNIDQVIAVYDYATMPDGLKPVTQQRERLINLQKRGKWVHRVHENYMIEEQPVRVAFVSDFGLNLHVKHERTANEALATNRRNHLIMKQELDEGGLENFSDEMLNHYAYDMWEHREFEDSIKYYKILLKRLKGKNVNPELLFQINNKVARAYQILQQSDNAFKFAFKTIKNMPNIADGYLLLGELFAEAGNWPEVEYYATKVLKMGKPKTTGPINEFDYFVTPRRMLMQVHIMRNELDKALVLSKELTQILNGNPAIKQEYHAIYDEQRKNRAIQAIGEQALYLQEHNKYGEEINALIDAIPLELKDNDLIRSKIKELIADRDRKTIRTVFKEGYQKSIVIFAGQGYEQWDGESDIKKGIGGSEGMCIQLSRELAKLGNKVFIYNDCGASDGKEFDGVKYIDFRKWDGATKSDIFISLRRPDVFSRVIKAKKQYLWLHDTEYGDVPLVNMYTPNKVIVLSEYHKEVIKANHGVLDNKQFFVSRNGLNTLAVEYADKNAKKRNPYQLIYASSYDRGLINLKQIWPKIKAAIPEATIKIFYGTVTMDKMIEMQARNGNVELANSMQAFKSEIMEMIKNYDGMKELGRVSQNELYKNFAESSIWLYPTAFTEISCITAMTAQAMGAVPVCTPVAALNETVNSKFGIKTELNKVADAVIHLLKNQEELEKRREPMITWAREAFDMGSLAKEWDLFFNED